MVKLFVGKKGSGKTKRMVELANEFLSDCKGSIVYISKDQRLSYDLHHEIRVVPMDEFEYVSNIDQYTGFLYGIVSGDHDIEKVFIDSILKEEAIDLEHMPDFLNTLRVISKEYNVEFYISLSAERSQLKDLDIVDFEVIDTN